MKLAKPSLSTSIIIGLFAGIATGLFFGELISFLSIIGAGFIGLLQMTILPFVVVALISGIGSLTLEKAKILLLKGGMWMLIFWLLSFVVIYLMLFIFPDWTSASFFSTSLVETRSSIDFLDVYIPSNPFESLVNNFIPAVVVFCILMGVALIYIPKKDNLLAVLNTVQEALVKMTGYIVKLTPIGVLALAADATSSLSIGEITKLQVYIIGFIVASFLITFLMLPMLISVVTPVKPMEIIKLSKEIIITAFTTGNLFVVLPQMTEMCKDLIRQKGIEKPNSGYYIDILIPVSFNFPNIGKLLLLYFILFSMWFNSTPLEAGQVPSFTLTGLFTLFGGVDVALPFLLRVFQIPSDMYGLYVITGIIIGRFSTMLATMNLIAYTLLSTLSITGHVKLNRLKLLKFTGVNLLVFTVFFLGLRLFFNSFVENPYDKDKVLANMHNLQKPMNAHIHKTSPFGIVNEYEGMPVLDRILQTGELRIGYADSAMPFSFFNAKSELVGFSIDMANMLSEDLNCIPMYYKLSEEQYYRALNDDYVDVIVGALSTPTTMQYINFSKPYINIHACIIVPDHLTNEYKKLKDVVEIRNVKLGVLTTDTYLLEKARSVFYKADFVQISSIDEIKNPDLGLDAILTAAENGAAWTLLNPEFSIVIPEGLRFKQTVAFGIKEGENNWENYLNNWIDLKKEGYRFNQFYDYWILGLDINEENKKWSVVKDVLHWVE